MKKSKVTLLTMTMVLAMSMIGGVVASAATTTTATGVAPVKATTAQSIEVQFSQADTIELTLSDNTVDFGDVTNNTATTTVTNPSELVAKIKSSLPYKLDLTATDNFTNTQDSTASQVPVTKLGVKVDGGVIQKFEGINVAKTIVSNASDTSALVGVARSHTIQFDLDQTIGFKSGAYKAPLTITASQQ